MILPVPNPSSVRFEPTVMRYGQDLFEDAQASFTRSRGRGASHPPHWSLRSSLAPHPLKIHQVGPYKASIAESIGDLTRLDSSVFQMTPALYAFLQAEYDQEKSLGFICCILEPGRHTYEPLAYSHACLAHGGGLFVPTKHYHVGDDTGEMTAEWDHEIYSIGTTLLSAHRQDGHEYYRPRPQNEIDWKQFPPEFQHSPTAELRRWACRGSYPNKDLVFRLEEYPSHVAAASLHSPRASTPPSPSRRGGGLETILRGLKGFWR